jgi:hypothetical protein
VAGQAPLAREVNAAEHEGSGRVVGEPVHVEAHAHPDHGAGGNGVTGGRRTIERAGMQP